MKFRIEHLTERKLVGKSLKMSYVKNQTRELWQSFMPIRKTVLNALNNDLYSIQLYPVDYNFIQIDYQQEFEKWAAVEVSDFNSIPQDLYSFILPEGMYAVFLHRGSSNEGANTFQYIFGTWLPNSGYIVDNRPHFELLGSKYTNQDPDSEEEFWIPVKYKI